MNLENVFCPLLLLKSRQKTHLLTYEQRKGTQSTEETEKQKKLPTAWEAHGRARTQSG